MSHVKLSEIFQANQSELARQLTGLSLPGDAQKIQVIASHFLNSLFERDGVYRQNLTQSEDFILQSALQLLQAQQNITVEISNSLISQAQGTASPEDSEKPGAWLGTQSASSKYSPLIGTSIGAIVGSFLGTWAAVCGAIAGTAISIYCASGQLSKPSNNQPSSHSMHSLSSQSSSPETNPTINTEIFTSIVGKVCECIDNLIQTYRVQVKKIENIYSQVEKPSLLVECSSLFSSIGKLSKAIEASQEQIPPKVLNAMDMVVESLENYGLTIKDGKVVQE